MTDKTTLPRQRIKGSRASICQWELRFTFLLKEQCEEFISAYLKCDIPIEFSYREELTESSSVHVIDVEGCWANNLSFVAKLLEAVDHNTGDENDA